MAVIYTYCRQSEHDKYFFNEPLNILNGKIQPPKFNLRNEIMVKKHVHATVLSQLIRLTLNNERIDITEDDKENIRNIINSVFPTFIVDYLFYDKEVPREEIYDISALNKVIQLYKAELINNARDIFVAYWPEADIEIVSEKAIENYINEMTDELNRVLTRMYKRMRWAVNKIRSIDYSSANQEEDKLVNRCKSYLAKLKRTAPENYTLSVLAMEGFLPGYGVYEASINAYVKNDFNGLRITQDFELNRPSSMAVREFVPGNMIYANGAKYKCSYYHLAANKEELNLEGYFVDIERNIIKKSVNKDVNYNNNNSSQVQALPINDVTLNFTSRIIDVELNRFQMPVNIMGELEKYHSGIRVYSLNNYEVKHHFGRKIRLINVGPSERVKEGKLGYPICSVCGATGSPYSSDKEIKSFLEKHKKSCGKAPDDLILYSDSVVDGIKIEGFNSQEEAINFSEAIKIGASIIIDMDIDDLQYFIYPSNNDEFAVFIYDPMPGGSGILQQVIEEWTNVIKTAIKALSNCEGRCQESCYSCMRTYRNVFVHGKLDRYLAKDILDAWIGKLELLSELPPNMELIFNTDSKATNAREKALYEILQKEGFPSFIEQKEIQIGAPYNRTIPDLYYEDLEDDIKVAIYLDGLSKDIHGNEEQMRVDRFIRNQLEDMLIDIIEVSCADLNDPIALKRSLAKIARKINRRALLSKYK